MPYRLIALDIDGTLYDSGKEIRPATLAALAEARARGAIVALASGRPQPGLARPAATLAGPGRPLLLVCYNGARIVEAETGAVLHETPVPREAARRLLKHAERFPVVPLVDDGRCLYVTDPAAFRVAREAQNCGLEIRIVANVAEALDFAPSKVLFAAPGEVLSTVAAELAAPFLGEFSFVQSSSFYLEATVKGVGKGSALRALCARLGIAPAEVIAFGDAQNDISMIEFAGHGVAMGNACDELKAVADEITTTNDEDGIAETLRHCFP